MGTRNKMCVSRPCCGEECGDCYYCDDAQEPPCQVTLTLGTLSSSTSNCGCDVAGSYVLSQESQACHYGIGQVLATFSCDSWDARVRVSDTAGIAGVIFREEDVIVRLLVEKYVGGAWTSAGYHQYKVTKTAGYTCYGVTHTLTHDSSSTSEVICSGWSSLPVQVTA